MLLGVSRRWLLRFKLLTFLVPREPFVPLRSQTLV